MHQPQVPAARQLVVEPPHVVDRQAMPPVVAVRTADHVGLALVVPVPLVDETTRAAVDHADSPADRLTMVGNLDVAEAVFQTLVELGSQYLHVVLLSADVDRRTHLALD